MIGMVRAHRRRMTLARWCSDIGSPPVFTTLSLTLAASLNNSTIETRIVWGIGLALLVAGAPMAYVIALVRRGLVTDVHLARRQERLGPLIFTFLTMLVAVLLARSAGAPIPVQHLLLLMLAQTALLGAITLFWKISFHAAAVALFSGFAIAVFGIVASPVLLLIPLISWARLEVRRHTLAQVVAGSIIGLLFATQL